MNLEFIGKVILIHNTKRTTIEINQDLWLTGKYQEVYPSYKFLKIIHIAKGQIYRDTLRVRKYQKMLYSAGISYIMMKANQRKCQTFSEKLNIGVERLLENPFYFRKFQEDPKDYETLVSFLVPFTFVVNENPNAYLHHLF
jgi:hypothetical protein